VGDLISLFRWKALGPPALRERFDRQEKAPPKAHDLRAARPDSRMAGRVLDPMAHLGALKDGTPPRRRAKLRFFRVFKLLEGVKADPSEAPVRELDAGFRALRWQRRL